MPRISGLPGCGGSCSVRITSCRPSLTRAHLQTACDSCHEQHHPQLPLSHSSTSLTTTLRYTIVTYKTRPDPTSLPITALVPSCRCRSNRFVSLAHILALECSSPLCGFMIGRQVWPRPGATTPVQPISLSRSGGRAALVFFGVDCVRNAPL